MTGASVPIDFARELRRVPVPSEGQWIELHVRRTAKKLSLDWVLYDMWEGEPFLWEMGTVSSHSDEAQAYTKKALLESCLAWRGDAGRPAS